MLVIDIGYIHMFNCDNYLKFSEINDTMYCICIMIKGPNKRPIYKESPKDLLKGLPRHLPPSFWDIWRPNFGTLVTETSVAQLRKKVRVFYGKLTIVHVGDLRTIIKGPGTLNGVVKLWMSCVFLVLPGLQMNSKADHNPHAKWDWWQYVFYAITLAIYGWK